MVTERLWRKRKTNGIGWDFETSQITKIAIILVNEEKMNNMFNMY